MNMSRPKSARGMIQVGSKTAGRENDLDSMAPGITVHLGMNQSKLPDGWQIRRLGELLREVDVRFADLSEAEGAALEVLSLTKNHGLILQSERFAKRIATEDTSKYKLVRQGQIVYNPYVIWEGAVHALRKHPAGLVSPVYVVWETRESDGGFIDYLLRTPPLIDAYNRLCSGAVNRRRSIREEAFAGIEIVVPSVSERRAIAASLRTVQEVKDVGERTTTATRQLKQSLLRHLFTYGPKTLVQAAHLQMRETVAGLVPMHWKLVPLESLIAEGPQNGLYKPHSDYGDGVPILRINDYPNEGRIVISSSSRLRVSKEELIRYGLCPGDLLVNRVNSLSHLGKTALVGKLREPIVFESNMMRFSLKTEQVLPEFLFRFLCTPAAREAMRGGAKRAVAQASINQGDVMSLMIPLPPTDEQSEIAAQLSAVDRKLEAEEARRAALGQLFKSLLHHLMTGRLRLSHLADRQGEAG